MDEVSSHAFFFSMYFNYIFDHREPLRVFKIMNNVEKLFAKIWIFYILFGVYALCEEKHVSQSPTKY